MQIEQEGIVAPPAIYIRMRRYDYPARLPFDGAYYDQPYLLIRALDACHAAVKEHEAAKVAASLLPPKKQ
jgi:hypothetical protein